MTQSFCARVKHIRRLPVSVSKTPPLQDYIDWCAEQEALVDPRNMTVHKSRFISDPKKLHSLMTMVHGGYSKKNILTRFGLTESNLRRIRNELPPHLS